MIRASIHQVLHKAWLEVEQWRVVDGRGQWVSIGRHIAGDIDDLANMGEAAHLLVSELADVAELYEEDWSQLDAFRI